MDDLVLPDGFLVTGRLWFLTVAAEKGTDFLPALAQTAVIDTAHGNAVLAFTEEHHAIEHASKQGDQRVWYFSTDDAPSLVKYLDQLTRYGATHLRIDPTETYVRLDPIADIRRAIS